MLQPYAPEPRLNERKEKPYRQKRGYLGPRHRVTGSVLAAEEQVRRQLLGHTARVLKGAKAGSALACARRTLQL
eukprot:1147194-Pelagomonas_calceolata.AAC.2